MAGQRLRENICEKHSDIATVSSKKKTNSPMSRQVTLTDTSPGKTREGPTQTCGGAGTRGRRSNGKRVKWKHPHRSPDVKGCGFSRDCPSCKHCRCPSASGCTVCGLCREPVLRGTRADCWHVPQCGRLAHNPPSDGSRGPKPRRV